MSLLTSLISYWKLDEASGSRADSHGSATLTDNNTVGSGTGKIGTGAQFVTANSEYLSRAAEAANTFGNADFTWAFWLKLDSVPSSEYELVMKRDYPLNTTIEYVVVVTASNFVAATGNGAGGFDVVSTSGITPTTGTWYFVVFQHDAAAGEISLQINDGTVFTVSRSTTPAGTAIPLQFSVPDTTYGLDGIMDEVGLWGRTLSSGEVSQLYAGITYPFSSNVDVDLTGVSGTGSVGTLTPSTGSATVALTGVSGAGSVGTLAPGISLGKVLVVAGGGGGSGGGGGGGALQYNGAFLLGGTSYAVTVGAGGSGTQPDVVGGTNGGNSSFGGITAFGGGGGGQVHNPGGSGGTGGGGGPSSVIPTAGGTGSQGGNGGTNGSHFASPFPTGGGGGAGANGNNSPSASASGDGGNGTSNSITGFSVVYGGGGGGGVYAGGGTPGVASGGGGDGGGGAGSNGVNGRGGGGGGASSGSTGGSGGSGVVIIAYLTADFTGHTGGDDTGTDGSYTWVKFTASGTLTLSVPVAPVSVALTGVEGVGGVGNLTPSGQARIRGGGWPEGEIDLKRQRELREAQAAREREVDARIEAGILEGVRRSVGQPGEVDGGDDQASVDAGRSIAQALQSGLPAGPVATGVAGPTSFDPRLPDPDEARRKKIARQNALIILGS